MITHMSLSQRMISRLMPYASLIEQYYNEGCDQLTISKRLPIIPASSEKYQPNHEYLNKDSRISQGSVGAFITQILGLSGRNYEFCKSLTPRQRSVLVGTVLGDGYLSRIGRTHALLSMAHCRAQESWLKWKVEELSNLHLNVNLHYADYPYIRDDGSHAVRHVAKSWTRCHPLLTNYWERFYLWQEEKNSFHKVITPEILSEVDDLALAVWFGDDGTWSGTYAGLALGNVSDQEIELVRDWLCAGVMEVRLDDHGEKCKVLALRHRECEIVFSRIKQHLHPSMHYKLGPWGLDGITSP